MAPADPAGVVAAAKDLRARSFGAATAKYRELGTLANLLAFNALSTLPTRNFQAATFEGAPALAAEELAEARSTARNSCASCTSAASTSTSCPRVAAAPTMRVEYENVFALGPMCGVSDADDVLAASARCDELGIDTISAGGTIAWAMECAERGLIDAPWLRFGDGAALLRALDEIGSGTGLGPLLAEGSRRAAAQVGQGSADFAPHVKGLELPGYEPRSLHAMALGLAVNARGADHNRSGAYEADLAGDLDRLDGGAGARRRGDRDRGPRGGHGLADPVQVPPRRLHRADRRQPDRPAVGRVGAPALAGHRLGRRRDELRATARRIVLAKRAYNEREGWRPEDDWLPPRLLAETPRDGLRPDSAGSRRSGCARWSTATGRRAASTRRAARRPWTRTTAGHRGPGHGRSGPARVTP